jgi:putative ABC transport system permease protein
MKLRFWRRKDRDSELDEELRGHMRLAITNLIERGDTPEHATAASRREFGNFGLVKEVTREMWGWGSLERLGQDLRYGARTLAKNSGFTLIAVLTLALGIGANTAMFSVLNAFLFRPLQYPHSERLVQLLRITTIDGQSWPGHSTADFLDQREKNSVFENMTALTFAHPAFVQQGQLAETLNALEATADFFPTFGVQPELGRVFTTEEDQPGPNLVAVISDRFWKSRFSGDPGVLGRKLQLDGESVTVIGVMPPSFEQPILWSNIDLWRPIAFTNEQRQSRGTHYLLSVARMKAGVSIAQAQENMTTLAANIRQANPSKADDTLRLQPFQQALASDVWRKVNWLTFGLACFVLLIACANLANLQLVRTAARTREHAMRAALGAGRFRLLRQSLTESLLISLLGGALSLLFAIGTVEFIDRRLFSERPGAEVPLDFRVFGFALLCSVLAGVLFGAVPAWLASRPDVNQVLKENLRGANSGSGHRLKHTLIVGEVAFALALLTGAGLFLRGIQRFSERDPGWRIDGLLLGQLSLQGDSYATAAQRAAFYHRLEPRLAALPGVEQVALSQSPPDYGFYSIDDFVIDGQPEPKPGEFISFVEPVSTGYFDTFGVPLFSGRTFTDTDTDGHPAVTIINETMAIRFWPNESAIGKRIGKRGTDRQWREVVGVVKDMGFPAHLGESQTPYQMFFPLAQASDWNNATITLRTSMPPEAMSGTLRRAVAELDANEPVNQIHTMRALVKRGLRDISLLGTLLGAFAVLGLILAAIGIYGVISYSVTERTGEIGVRMALGARKPDVLWMVMGKGTRLILMGAALGCGGSYAVSRLLAWAVPDLPTRDPAAMVAMSISLVVVALLACYLPARRATRVDPMVALRYE